MERRPRAVRLVLGDDVGVLAGVAEGAAVEAARQRPDHVAHHEAHRTAHRGVGAEARAEQVVAGVELQALADRPVDDHEHAGAAGGGGRPVVAPARVGHGLDRRDHHRHVLRQATGHDGVDGDLLRAHRHLAVGDEADLGPWLLARRVEHGLHRAFCRRHHRQAVGPSLLEAELDRAGQVGSAVAGRGERRHGGIIPQPRSGPRGPPAGACLASADRNCVCCPLVAGRRAAPARSGDGGPDDSRQGRSGGASPKRDGPGSALGRRPPGVAHRLSIDRSTGS